MFVPLKIVTEYSLLKSTIKIDALISFLKKHNIPSCAICDDNLYGVMEFFNKMSANNLKPIIGLKIYIDNYEILLYPKSDLGYKNLLKIHTLKETKELSWDTLGAYLQDIKIVLPYASYSLYEKYPDAYLAYQNDTEKIEAMLMSDKCVYVREARVLEKEDTYDLVCLEAIDKGCLVSEVTSVYDNYYLNLNVKEEDRESVIRFIQDIDLHINKKGYYIPVYKKDVDSTNYLTTLAIKGLQKRLNGVIPLEYQKRLDYELSVIRKMGFVDYFLIVYDYVLYAKKNNILVGPGRGSAAGSLVSYAIGITNVDPMKYNLLFERFLNPERISMPDIDIDFEYTKRGEVIDYVRNKYGIKNVAPIMTFGSLASKQVLRDVGRIFNVDTSLLDKFVGMIDAKVSLKENALKKEVENFLQQFQELAKIYKEALKLEGLKRHVSTHAAGVVIASTSLDDVIPLTVNGDAFMTGVTMEYLEPLGLLKMDFLALRNLTIIANVLDLIYENTGNRLDLNKIPLDELGVYELFAKADTEGIFQYESSGMKNLMKKLKPTSFSDLVASVALFRPGPMNNIDMFVRRKHGQEKVTYLTPDLEPILKETYGVIVYQEQVMQILVLVGGYSYAEADNIRRAMSKKKESVILEDKEHFISNAKKRGYQEEVAREIYDLILRFANYGFNKAHSVSYALIGYQMAYLKVKYPLYFITNLLNMSLGSEIKTKEYIDEARKKGIKILKPDINEAMDSYKAMRNALMLPLGSIKSLGTTASKAILDERANKGAFKDYLDFVARIYGHANNKKTIMALILAGALDSFGLTKQTMIMNLDAAINYATLVSEIDSSLVMEPSLEEYKEYPEDVLREKELSSYGFYVTNHPASKYQDKNIMKLEQIKAYFDKRVQVVVLVEKIKTIKTKKGDNMAFITASDETGNAEFVMFPSGYSMLKNIRNGDIISIQGLVTKRFDSYQITINGLQKVGSSTNA